MNNDWNVRTDLTLIKCHIEGVHVLSLLIWCEQTVTAPYIPRLLCRGHVYGRKLAWGVTSTDHYVSCLPAFRQWWPET